MKYFLLEPKDIKSAKKTDDFLEITLTSGATFCVFKDSMSSKNYESIKNAVTLKSFMLKHGLSVAEFARRVGINKQHLQECCNPRKLSVETMEKIKKVYPEIW